MKKKFQTPFAVMSVIAFTFLAAFIILYIVSLSVSGNLLDNLKVIVFDANSIFITMFKNIKSALVEFILFVVFTILSIVMIIVSCVGIKKKPGAKIIGIVLSALFLLVAIFYVPLIPSTLKTLTDKAAISTGMIKVEYMIIQWSIFASACLYVVFSIIAIVFGIAYAKANNNNDVYDQLYNEVPSAEDTTYVPELEAAEAPSDPVETVEPQPEPVPSFVPEPEPVVEEAIKETVEQPVKEKETVGVDKETLASLLKDVVRDIVRDEIARNNANQMRSQEQRPTNDNHSIVGATFAGPLVVQYFNGGVPCQSPAPQQVQVAPAPEVKEVKPEPVKEEKVEEVKEEPVVEAAPAPVSEEPVPEVKEEKKPIVRIPFSTRMLEADKEMQDNYNEIKNEILSYGVKSRVSSAGDTFRLHRKTYVKLTIAGKSLKLYFALNPDDYKDSTIPVQDASAKGIYQEIPLVFKVKSALSMRRCKELIQATMEQDGLEQGEVLSINWVKEIKALEKEKASDDED